MPPPRDSSCRMVSVSISRSRMWLRLSVPHTTVSTPSVCRMSRFLGLEARATVRFTPNSRLAIWHATRLVSSVLVTATKASQLATSAVRRVSKLRESPQMTGISSVSARVRHSASCGSMMVTLWWWDSRLWARYMPTRPPPAIQTFISLPHSTVCKTKTGCFTWKVPGTPPAQSARWGRWSPARRPCGIKFADAGRIPGR